jgi:hypothetical protein
MPIPLLPFVIPQSSKILSNPISSKEYYKKRSKEKTIVASNDVEEKKKEEKSNTTNSNLKLGRLTHRQQTSHVNSTSGRNIIVCKSIPFAINFIIMYKLTVPISSSAALGIVARDIRHGLDISATEKQSTAVESSAKTRHHGTMDIVITGLNGKGAAVAAEDVGGGGFGVGSVVASAVEVVAGCCAVYEAGGDLGVDGEGVGAVVVPHVVDVGSPVV